MTAPLITDLEFDYFMSTGKSPPVDLLEPDTPIRTRLTQDQEQVDFTHALPTEEPSLPHELISGAVKPGLEMNEEPENERVVSFQPKQFKTDTDLAAYYEPHVFDEVAIPMKRARYENGQTHHQAPMVDTTVGTCMDQYKKPSVTGNEPPEDEIRNSFKQEEQQTRP